MGDRLIPPDRDVRVRKLHHGAGSVRLTVPPEVREDQQIGEEERMCIKPVKGGFVAVRLKETDTLEEIDELVDDV